MAFKGIECLKSLFDTNGCPIESKSVTEIDGDIHNCFTLVRMGKYLHLKINVFKVVLTEDLNETELIPILDDITLCVMSSKVSP